MRAAMIVIVLGACSSAPQEDCGTVATVARTQTDLKVADRASPCAVDDDCTLVKASLSCYSGCFVAVPVSQQMALDADLSSLSQVVCGDTTCEVNAGCVPVFARCSGGRCVTVEGVRDAGTGDGGSPDGG